MNKHLPDGNRIAGETARENEADRVASFRWSDLRHALKEPPRWALYLVRLTMISFPVLLIFLVIVLSGAPDFQSVWQVLAGPLCVVSLVVLAKLPVYLFVRILRETDRSKDAFLGRANHALARTGGVSVKETGGPTLNQEHVTGDSPHKIRGSGGSGDTGDGCF